MASEFRMRRRVEFVETDMAGIVHFSNFFRWMEQTEHAFFRSLGFTLHSQSHDGEAPSEMYGWARVHASCDYEKPLRYQDLFEVRLRVVQKSVATLTFELGFYRVDTPELSASDDHDGELQEVARGTMKTCCVSRQGSDPIRAREMPEEIHAAIEIAAPNTA